MELMNGYWVIKSIQIWIEIEDKSYLENIFIGKWLDIEIYCSGLDGFNIQQRVIRETTLSLTEYVLFNIEVILFTVRASRLFSRRKKLSTILIDYTKPKYLNFDILA